MSRPKYDGVIEAVHYSDEDRKQIAWVRGYLRRGSTFSDRVILDRKNLIELIRSGKKFYAGCRVPLEAGTFEVTEPLDIIDLFDGHTVVVTGETQSNHDVLEGIPVL